MTWIRIHYSGLMKWILSTDWKNIDIPHGAIDIILSCPPCQNYVLQNLKSKKMMGKSIFYLKIYRNDRRQRKKMTYILFQKRNTETSFL